LRLAFPVAGSDHHRQTAVVVPQQNAYVIERLGKYAERYRRDSTS